MGHVDIPVKRSCPHDWMTRTCSSAGTLLSILISACIPFGLSLRRSTPGSWSTASASGRRRRLLLLRIDVHVYMSLLIGSCGICVGMGPLLPL